MFILIGLIIVVVLIVVGIAAFRSEGSQYGKFNQKGNNFHDLL